MRTRQQRINQYVDAHSFPIIGSILAAALFGPLGLALIRPGLGITLTAIGAGLLFWWTRQNPYYLELHSPILFFVGAIWMISVVIAPFEAKWHNERAQAKAELMATFDPRE